MTMRRAPRRTRRRTDPGAHRASRPALSFPAVSFPPESFPAPLSPPESRQALLFLATPFPATPIGWGMPTR